VFAEKIKIPLGHLCSSMEGSYSFIPPEEVHVIGSFATNTYINTDQKIGIDMSVVMPKDFFADRDFLNYRYFLKRNLYLAHVYLQLVEKKSLANARFQFTSGYGSSYKPLLLIQYNGKLLTQYLIPKMFIFTLT
jgi:U3 small nucleolar RNA-associated protein 22